jgi:hypothetical protein
MGITLVIGNAETAYDTSEFPELHASFIVKKTCFNQEDTNFMQFSYGGFQEFCKDTGIIKYLGYPNGPLIDEHPGCKGITKKIADDIRRFVVGFEMDEKRKSDPLYKDKLARLNTFSILTSWAVSECELPAIYNY